MSEDRRAETSKSDPPRPGEKIEYIEIGPLQEVMEGTDPGQDSEDIEHVEIGPLHDTEIGPLLRELRGERSLRQLEEETGIAYSYLSIIERGNKRPGPRVLSRLAAYHDVPLDDLLGAAGYPQQADEEGKPTIADIQRSFRFVVEDPELEEYRKPSEAAPIDLKRFVVQLYEHYTGKRILSRRNPA